MSALRTGIAALTVAVKHICKLLTTYRPAINGLIDAAVSGGHITSSQATTLKSWLDGASAACDVLRIVSGY
jgi:hypothetical protein